MNLESKKWGLKINRVTGEPMYDTDDESEHDSEYENEYSENEYSEDENIVNNMTTWEKNLYFQKKRFLNKERHPKKSKCEDLIT